MFTLLFLFVNFRLNAQENDYYGQIAAQAEQEASQSVKDRIKKEIASDRAQAQYEQGNNTNTTQPRNLIKPGVQGNQWSQPAPWGQVAKPENNVPQNNIPPQPISNQPEQQRPTQIKQPEQVKQPEQPEQPSSVPAATGIPSSTSPASSPNIFMPQQSATPNR